MQLLFVVYLFFHFIFSLKLHLLCCVSSCFLLMFPACEVMRCHGVFCCSSSPPALFFPKAASSSSGKDRVRQRQREKGGEGFKMPSRWTTTSNPLPPAPGPPPPHAPLRSSRKPRSSSSHSSKTTPKQSLDVDKVGGTSDSKDARHSCRDTQGLQGFKFSELDRNWEDVTTALQHRGTRMRSAVYHTSDLPSMLKAKGRSERSDGKGRKGQSKSKATFV